ncbi:hypothetical protein HID58_062543 [Brassica napus]|uniref:Uncharacterized protein n=1 Tax=Brassica napus TaxID=3708 RepID=A0ABQ8A2C8_BRANA|nr:hypothetical protein HID58_062543 [Brassica napus]
MKKDGEGYAYVGETGTKNVEWKIDEITWERFSLFCKEDSLIRAPIGLLWFKFEKEEMKDLRYAYDYLDEEMRILRSAGKLGVDVVEVFVEHIPNTEQDERSCSDEDEDMKKTYNENIKPVNGENLWKRLGKPSIGIPELRKPRGRPRTRERRKEPFEDLENAGKSTRHGRVPKCSRCLQMGHIKSGCKNEQVVYEGPKNKRVRPRIHPVGPPKPPSTRRKRTSSSQPVQAAESSSQIPTHSTAPQPSVSSTDPKPHAKKAPRGLPLKVRKITNIPHGVGTLWSPFTNRPFEVLGDRVYDRSDLNPQPPPQE